MNNNLIKKLLCLVGLHQWIYNQDSTKRWCKCCGKTQEYWYNFIWRECIDGEPIDTQ